MGAENYYDLTALLRTRLEEAGENKWAEKLLLAERTGSTSGEIIQNVSLVVRELSRAGVLKRIGAKKLARKIRVTGHRAWMGGSFWEVAFRGRRHR